jgi:cysteine desulfurase/selenocysteine lyase
MNETLVRHQLNIDKIRKDFPILNQEINGHRLIYLDNAATTQKPKTVIDSLVRYYTHYNSNIHRGIHSLAEQATSKYEETRRTVQRFINAAESDEVIFTKGTTESINLVASCYGKKYLQKDDEVIISAMEHHSNIVPWQMICEEKQAKLKVIPVNKNGDLDLETFERLITSGNVKIVSLVYVSNALGTINPVQKIIDFAHDNGAVVVLDGAQASSHLHIDVRALNVDFYAFSGHKMYGPTGVGVLYGKRDLLENMPPYQGGGEMINEVRFEKTTYNEIPYKFEAGTPNIADVIAFQEAINYLTALGKENILAHEEELSVYAYQSLQNIPGFTPIGISLNKIGVISFIIENIHHFDLGMMLDARGIAVRTGHHCTQPLMNLFNIEGTVRASLAVYNTKEEIDLFSETLQSIVNKTRKI